MKTRISYLCVSLTLLSTLNSAQRRAGSSRRSQAKAEAQRRRINPNPLYATKTLMAFSVLLGLAFSAFAQGTAFSYQGRLNDGGNPANGTYDLRFALYDSTNSPGVLIAGPLTNSAAGVTNGLFTVTLDFGTNVFTGQDCWLEIAVRTNGDVGDFSVLSPRQKLTSAPYATRAANFSGAVSDSQLSANVARLDANQTFSGAVTLNNRSNSYAGSFTGNGAGLTNVPGAVPWHYFFGNSVLAEPNTAYVVNLASQTIVLPTQPNSYDMVHVYGAGPGGWQVVASPGQVINNGISPGVIWTPRDSPREWWSVASSADGGKLAAVVLGGQIYTSTDGGATWIARDSNRYWYSIASSSDGSKLAAVAGGELNADRIYTSTDSGVTWTPRETNRTWYAIASSADGSRLVAVVANGQIYTSTDGGTNWIARASSNTWCAVASSADGSKLVAAAGAYAPGQIYTSTDGGTNWTLQSLPSRNWWSVASSADGSKLALVQNSGQIYTSTDSGVTWTARETNRNWRCVASSPDGTKLVAVAVHAQIYTSTDSGVTWTARDASHWWTSAAMSADGSRWIAADLPDNGDDGYIYISASTFVGGPGLTADLMYAGGNLVYGVGVWQPLAPGGDVALRTGGNAFTGLQTVTGGSVGIGTANPQRALQVGDSTIAGSEGMIHLASRSSSGAPNLREWELGVPQTGDVVTGDGYSFVIRDASAGSSTRLMIRWDTGNVGIGTSNPGPSYKLQVNGLVAGMGPYVDASDARFKTNVAPLARPLETILQLRGVNYDWRVHEFPDYGFDAHRQIGFLAQEVKEVLPEVVSQGADGYYSIAYSRIIPVLVEAMKEQQRQLSVLQSKSIGGDAAAPAAIQGLNQKVEVRGQKSEDRIQKLEAENAELKQRLEALEKIVLNQKPN